jgi:hypothetical protein
MASYQEVNEVLQWKLEDLSVQKLKAEQTGDQEGLQKLSLQEDRLWSEKVAAEANYPGDWTTLLYGRMRDDGTKRKFIDVRNEAMVEMKEGEPNRFDKEEVFRSHYQRQIDEYDERIEKIFSRTGTYPAKDGGKGPLSLGAGSIDDSGVVFSDAVTRDDQELLKLTPRQNNIIEAHEKGHGLRDFTSDKVDSLELRSVLDVDTVRKLVATQQQTHEGRISPGYYMEAEEIAERMAQLKNYYGMKGNEQFTERHLAHARDHYVEDTGLDNGMSIFFGAITPENESKFINVINKYPL